MPVLFTFGAGPSIQKILNKHVAMAEWTNRLEWFHFTDKKAVD